MHRIAFLVAVTACSSSHGGNNPDAPPSSDGARSDGSAIDDAPPGSGFSIVSQFDGDSGPGLAACTATGGHCDRPDGNLAADGTHVVQVTWQHVNTYDYTGHMTASVTLSQFITNAGLSPMTSTGKPPYEAHVVFDEHVGRWIVTASCLYDCVMVSATSDPNGTWQGIYLNHNGSDPSMHLGYDKNGVYLAEFDPNAHDANTASFSFAYFAIPSAEIAWTGTFAPAHLNKSSGTPLDGQPAIDHDTAKAQTAPAFFLCKTCPAGGCQNNANFAFQWLVTTVTWNGTTASYSADQLVKTGIGSTQSQWLYNTPLAVPQPNSSVPLRVIEDHRVLDAVERAGHLYAVLGSGPCTTSCQAQGSDANDLMFWADLDCTMASACKVAATAKVSDPALHLFYPSVGVDGAGNSGIVASAGNATTPASLVGYSHLAADPVTQISAPTMIFAGSQPYTCTGTQVSFENAVGLETVRDPTDATKLWTVSQYAGSANACVWKTRIVEYQLQ